MKKLLFIALLFISENIFAQSKQIIANDNTLIATIDGKEFNTQPRRVRIGSYYWVTANLVSPDRSLRFWFVDFTHNDIIPEIGKYLVIDEDYATRKETEKMMLEGKLKGVAVVKYVEETKSPRMEFHVGEALKDGNAIIEITNNKEGFLEGTFSMNLEGTYWKEKAGATVFGGMGRLIDKAKDKAKTSASGYDQDIDPEGNGYRKQDKKDQIVITNGKFKLKFSEAK
ncbi:MAG: hypothetical protein V4683_18605 [Bacteroidota bacterium]